MITGVAGRRFSMSIRCMLAAGGIVPSIVIALAAEQPSTSPSTVTAEQLSATQQAASAVATQRTHRVVDGDTLWNVAKRLRPSYMSIAATMDLLYATNPEAFLDGDSTKLQKGYLLSFTPPTVQSAALVETAESIDTSTLIPRVDNLEPADSEETQMPDGSQIALDLELLLEEELANPETVETTPDSELSAQPTAQPQPQLKLKLDNGQPAEMDNPIPVQTGGSLDSQMDSAREPAQASLNHESQPQILDSAFESGLESSAESNAVISTETSDSQNPTTAAPSDSVESQPDNSQALAGSPPNQQLQPKSPVPTLEFGDNLVESKPPSIIDLAKLKAVFDDFRRDPPYTAMVAALLALVFTILGVRRLRKPLASSNHTNKSDQSPAQSTSSSADNSQQSTDGASDTENTDNLVDSVLSGPFAADSDDSSGIFADTESFGDAVGNFAENAAENKPTNLNNPEGEMDLPGQKELEAQMGDKFAELQSNDLHTADDAEHLDYIDPLKVKLDMATLCVEMGDQQTAREILEEIITEADEAGRAQAQAVLDQLDD